MEREDGIELEDSEQQPCEVWTRVMGYHRPVSMWNKGKVGEFQERKYFTEAAIAAHRDAMKPCPTKGR